MKRKHLILILVCDAVLIAGLLFWLTGCGIQRSLVRPADIPAYEQQQRKKIEKRQQDMNDFEQQRREQQRLMPQV
jgi:hypothetical protein